MPLNNPISEPQIPASVARDAEYLAADQAHLNAPNPHPQYLPRNPSAIEFAEGVNNIDFHTGTGFPKDRDARILASGGGANVDEADLYVACNLFTLSNKVRVGVEGAIITKMSSVVLSVNLPNVQAGQVTELSITVQNAAVGDMAFFNPIEMPSGLQYFKIMAVASAGTVKIQFHNLFSAALDLPVFLGRLLVVGF